MRTIRLGIFAMLTVVSFLTSCTVYQYTGRQTDIRNRGIDGTEQRAGIKVNYNKRVTATSNYQITRADAIREAEFLCIQDEKIDVVVDPIVKIEYHPLKMKKKFKATIIGFAGLYEERPTLLDESKQYTIDDVEKFKLMYDPSFLDYYYRQPLPQGGDKFEYNYYIKSSGVTGAPAKAVKAPKAQPAAPKSVMLKNQQPAARQFQPVMYDYRKARQLRDAGISLIVLGPAISLGIGMPLILTADERYSNYSGHIGAAIAMYTIGSAAFLSSIPMLSVGQVRMNVAKRQQTLAFSLNASSNGLGLGMTF